ncbi:hypothetical protein EDB80DRAFT_865984 [Ilyonectria destructans]|nr:hypothetical protein EDB80DRAFT_865984 [Ilyonectria destructans]
MSRKIRLTDQENLPRNVQEPEDWKDSSGLAQEGRRPAQALMGVCICVGKALALAGDDGAVQDLIHEFYTSGDLSKHFRCKHLSNLRDGDKIQCQACDKSLDYRQHLQNHALRVHGTVF